MDQMKKKSRIGSSFDDFLKKKHLRRGNRARH